MNPSRVIPQPPPHPAVTALTLILAVLICAVEVPRASAAEPSATSAVGNTVTNPVTGLGTTVTGLIVDPVGTPTAGTTQFVQTADGYAFLVKEVGQFIYNDVMLEGGVRQLMRFEILSKDTTAKTVSLRLASDPASTDTSDLPYQLLNSELQEKLFTEGTNGEEPSSDVVAGTAGVRLVGTGAGGRNGRTGALFVPPSSGGKGSAGAVLSWPDPTNTNDINILANNQNGVEVGSTGGGGGKGGDSWFSFWSARAGGDGGNGGSVTATTREGRQVATTGENRYGIFAYSRGGAGGAGGSGKAAPAGGWGGSSGNGGNATVTNHARIVTTGEGAFGVYVLSAGSSGGGGGGQWGIGGKSGTGGPGGNGGAVSATNDDSGTLSTFARYAHGILAQSIGGSGGSSGSSDNLIVSLKSSGAAGGDGGTVSVTNAGKITTGTTEAPTDDSRGIFAQSIGGGGGAGGSTGGLVALGGSGAAGGSASTVKVTNTSTGNITTTGDRSDAIFAQSVGGSGGSGSDAGGLVSIGGTGSVAGNGGEVTVDNRGSIITKGHSARGIVAESVGGGGGDGGSSGGFVSVGGSGSGGGFGMKVAVTNGGSIITKGDDAKGIVAQSIGGGGGNGGSAGAVGVFAGVAIGGKGGKGGAGGNVDVTLQGRNAATPSLIETGGDRATGLFAQSVGGGGGNGGGAVAVSSGFGASASFAIGGDGNVAGQGGDVTLKSGGFTSNLQTGGDDAAGVFLQSVGGGGGNGGYAIAVATSAGPVSGSLSVAVGGTGGAGGDGGRVTVGAFDGTTGEILEGGFSGNILTTGDRSTGLLAQSVGGGGGNGGLAVAGSGSGSLLVSGSISVGLGREGGKGGVGGTVLVGTEGDITTTGVNSTALLVQSVGGGGGNGGGSITAALAASGAAAGSVGVSVGGKAGNASVGGNVTAVVGLGNVSTSKQNSGGIVVQSVGGSGGNGGYVVAAGGSGAGVAAGAVNVGLGGAGGTGGNGGAVTADFQSNVHTKGANSGAVLVQSVGGGGGNGGFTISAGASGAGVGSGAVSVGLGGTGGAGGLGGAVNASSSGTIMTEGRSASGFVAQSIGGGGGNGGYSVTLAGSAAGVGSGAVSVGLGGVGGTGNNGKSVVAATSAGSVTTGGESSVGILAQSVGGGGGNGGFSVSGAGSGAGVGSGAVSVGLGGKGGAAGVGGNVTLKVDNDVTTSGRNSAAVVAQSIGGGGGNGGFSVAGAASVAGVGSGSVAVGLGGDGAGGGNGGIVIADVAGVISTNSDGSTGILAQSVGGGGGNGGFNISGVLSGAGVGSGAVNVGLGGNGEGGGDGGVASLDPTKVLYSVSLISSGSVTTRGANSAGIVAQSIGGGGGNGGFNVSAGLSGAGVGSGAVSVGLGGKGGGGGKGLDVFAHTSSDVWTSGHDSSGVLAQSVGGGGGNGGFNISGSLSGAGIGSGGVSVGLGGAGGAGSTGGYVDASSSGAIITRGVRSSGFVAQSIGGGGGNGGFTITGSLSGAGTGGGAISVGLGGNGGTGNHAGAVHAVVDGAIWVFGEGSTGVLAQSVGGGGGNGGFDITAGASAAGVGSGSITVGLAGGGGGGGRGGMVDLAVNNTVHTGADDSAGVIGQSIGGGGGNGGFTISATASGAGTGSGTVGVGLGGTGGVGANAGAVVVSTKDYIETAGARSAGVLAQSVGGGGGNGGFSVTVAGSGAGTGGGAVSVGLGGDGTGGGDGSTVGLTVANDVKTAGNHSAGVVAQSVGGGGGNGGFNVSVAGSAAGTGSGAVGVGLGGSAGDGGDAGVVTASVTGDIQTAGDNSTGLLVQSVGGGGGNGGFNVTATISGAGTGSGSASVGIGGSGGGGGNSKGSPVNHGLAVSNTFTGDVRTEGADSSGVVAQSLGGGGGNGGLSVAGTVSAAKTGSAAASVAIGGSGGGGGNAAGVENTVTGDISTQEQGSGGVLAQSLGGGGGNGGISVSGAVSLAGSGSGAVSVGIGGSGGDGGDSGAVTNAVTGTVLTSGNNAFGVIAQSLGGGGGNGGLNVNGGISASKENAGALAVGVGGAGGGGGEAADVTNTVTGYVQTLGDDAAGILAQSVGGGGGNGGLNVTGAITAAKSGSGSLAVGVGGFGGDGEDGANVTNTFTGGVLTQGDNSGAIIAQSLGGGGGNGALNVTASVNLSKESGGTLGVGVGGFGGGGGNAGDVTSTVTTTSDHSWIATSGDSSDAVVAQSVAGSGGRGGMNISGSVNLAGKKGAAIGIGVGGFGGGGGNAGDVTLDVTGKIATAGADSKGFVAQSIGGGGGSGGTNIAGTLSLARTGNGGAASIGVGGFGGEGGDAGNVVAKFDGSIASADGTALIAQSLGGGGGNGGVSVSAGLSYAAGKDGDGHALVVGVGGFGSTGGSAGTVDVTVTGGKNMSALGNGHSAIFAQSVGGAGGHGAVNVSGGLASDAPIVVGVGGLGGDGGVAETVTVSATADLSAAGKNAPALFAQSLGGGGGNGGLNVSGAISFSNDTRVPSITFGIGGFGGDGAVSGDVNVTQHGLVTTAGEWSHGIQAQSIAGGGGNGALNVAGSLNRETSKKESSESKTQFAVSVGIGGFGGDAADAADASVNSIGAIATNGDYARGIFAQSVGGGGGTGGINVSGVAGKDESPVVVGIGGFGGAGGNAGAVSVTRGTTDVFGGAIVTSGKGAYGIEASSIGGGGGDAGGNILLAYAQTSGAKEEPSDTPKTRRHPTATGVDDKVFANFDKVLDELEGRKKTGAKPKETKTTYAFQIGIGGAGGDAGDGGAATVGNFGDITTLGVGSHGLLAQSIAGGGGNASLNMALGGTGGSDKAYSLNFMLGGATGDGGTGGNVEVENGGTIDTSGTGAYGIIAQSIGGGGGNAGLDYTNTETEGSSLDIKIGRKGGTGGAGGAVSVDSSGTVLTRGDTAHAILAQSVGNGGGTSSSTAMSGSFKRKPDKKQAESTEKEIEVDLEIGIDGGVGGAAGDVDVTASGVVATGGDGSHGIFAQSVGGGGGSAGSAGGFESMTSAFALMVGGFGGEGGTGGDVHVNTEATIVTFGDSSIGVLAQSVGGGGGEGGGIMAIGKRKETGGFMLGVGGGGGTGAVAGQVSVANAGAITTGGDDSYGVLAQSIGGGGGKAGSVIHNLYNTDASGDVDVEFMLGGSGGTGALGGLVNVTNTGTIETWGARAIGVLAQSVGGGGGEGSYVISNSISTKGGGNKVNTTVGGDGGEGGGGGAVTVINRADSTVEDSGIIVTHGDAAHGIFATSIGGGGGNGGTSITSNTAVRAGEKSASNAFAVSIGGVGGSGGTGGDVDVTNGGAISTTGRAAHGIVAQSIGGGGGSGGLSLAGNLVLGSRNDSNTNLVGAVSVGGWGGDGNNSGNVSVTSTGSITAAGEGSYGVFAQSVGGGGGNGGFAAALSSSMKTNPAADPAPYFTNIGVGGRGGTGGNSGDVHVNHTGSILVRGNNAYGIFAQSVSGGGGTVGASLSSPVWMATDLGVDLALGFAGASGTAGIAEINTTGTVVTAGRNSRGIFVQQVNGGGGDLNVFMDVSTKASELASDTDENAAATNAIALGARAHVKSTLSLGVAGVMDAVSNAVEAVHTGDLATLGDISVADVVQSIGGGGGNGRLEFVVNNEAAVDLTTSLGGSLSTGAAGGAVSFQRKGDVYTLGNRSVGSSIQSIGGGGGSVDVAVQTVATEEFRAPAENSVRTMQAFAASDDRLMSLSLGATGGSGNNGGAVAMQFAGNQATAGDRSPVLVVQSIGAGGGSALVTGMDRVNVVIGGSAGAQGDGNGIGLSNTGDIQTKGALSHGVLLQSIGGGGGVVFTDLPARAIGLTTAADNQGNGGNIRFHQTGDIVVTGDQSIGVLAQSIGGGGGAVDRMFAGTAGGAGRSGSITLDLNGNVAATGAEGVAVFAQSSARDGQGDILLTLPENKIIVGGIGGTGVWISGGAANRFTNRGTVRTLDGLSGMAIRATSGDDVVDNYGTVCGGFALGLGADRFVNHAGALLQAGRNLDLGDELGWLINAGDLEMGDAQSANRVQLTGSFQQTATGITYAALDFRSGEIDGIEASGAVDIKGEIKLSLLNIPVVPAGEYSKTLFAGKTGATFEGARLSTPPSAVITYALGNPTGKAVNLAYTVDFSPSYLGSNLATLGDYINGVQNAGSSPALAETIVALVGMDNVVTYRHALSQLSPEFYGEHQAMLVRGAGRFGEALLDYMPRAQDATQTKGRSVWMQEFIESSSHQGYSDFKTTHVTSDRTLLGIQQADGNWAAGATLGLEHSRADGFADHWTSKGATEWFGLSLRREAGQSTLSVSAAYGWNKTEAHRWLDVTAPYRTSAKRYMEIASGVVRAAHRFSRTTSRGDAMTVRPAFDIGVLRLMTKNARETGADAQSLVLPGNCGNHAWITPRLEFEFEHTGKSGWRFRPYVRVGLQRYLEGSETKVRAGFLGAPSNASDMLLPIRVGRNSFQATAGFEVLSRGARSISVEYQNVSADHFRSDSGSIKGSITF